ncbi:hypothetical protein QBC32DRAFT_391083 [Pseudoneurospora amorphoporcata]|uniref:Uncharacterized protein n=1 Tax=Pseudoneurospora amorphoporcata TaxID=241081 RepID=A0AAN6SAJ0_9PEZI|nr:hypothetical protein QBC32DRAFT_391083 [Pseudoneurospora amorphoporcata]
MSFSEQAFGADSADPPEPPTPGNSADWSSRQWDHFADFGSWGSTETDGVDDADNAFTSEPSHPSREEPSAINTSAHFTSPNITSFQDTSPRGTFSHGISLDATFSFVTPSHARTSSSYGTSAPRPSSHSAPRPSGSTNIAHLDAKSGLGKDNVASLSADIVLSQDNGTVPDLQHTDVGNSSAPVNGIPARLRAYHNDLANQMARAKVGADRLVKEQNRVFHLDPRPPLSNPSHGPNPGHGNTGSTPAKVKPNKFGGTDTINGPNHYNISFDVSNVSFGNGNNFPLGHTPQHVSSHQGQNTWLMPSFQHIPMSVDLSAGMFVDNGGDYNIDRLAEFEKFVMSMNKNVMLDTAARLGFRFPLASNSNYKKNGPTKTTGGPKTRTTASTGSAYARRNTHQSTEQRHAAPVLHNPPDFGFDIPQPQNTDWPLSIDGRFTRGMKIPLQVNLEVAAQITSSHNLVSSNSGIPHGNMNNTSSLPGNPYPPFPFSENTFAPNVISTLVIPNGNNSTSSFVNPYPKFVLPDPKVVAAKPRPASRAAAPRTEVVYEIGEASTASRITAKEGKIKKPSNSRKISAKSGKKSEPGPGMPGFRRGGPGGYQDDGGCHTDIRP